MRLFLEDNRDLVTISPVLPENIHERDVVLAEVSHECYVLHRVISRQGDRLLLMGDGNVKGTESCTVANVIGKATAFYRKGRTTPDLPESPKWRIYSSLWLAFKPLRRYILAAYQRIWLPLFPVKTHR